MERVHKCYVCDMEYTGSVCPECKERAEREFAQKEHEKVMKERITKEESKKREAIFFEDDEEVKLRDGRIYRIPPLTLKDARYLMQNIGSINVDNIFVNFIPLQNKELENKRIDTLFNILEKAFLNYSDIDRDYIEQYVDLKLARKIIEILIDVNGLKK